jgi:signal transduction histidine kinase
MKFLRNIFEQLNVADQCRKYDLSLWECPQFLFLIMGLVIIASAIIAYMTGTRYIEDPLVVALIVLILVAILFSVAFIITRSLEKLSEVNRIKSEFISVATHQLRSPLANLRWVIELLVSGKMGKIEESHTEYFRILKENIYRMQESISDLLTVSRLEASKLPVKKREFSLKNLIENLLAEYKDFAGASNVKITLKAEKNLPKIFSDYFQVRLIIENLLDNAVRYTENKGKIDMNLLKRGRYIYFSIKDTGVGIPEADKKYIFKKFFRSKNILEHQTQGSGLGLYISKSIAKRLGGKMGFKSKETEGSTFWFTLPIK